MSKSKLENIRNRRTSNVGLHVSRVGRLKYWQQTKHDRCAVTHLQGGPKMAPFLYASSSNINRFSKFFHCQNQETIGNKTVAIAIDPTTLKVCHYATLWNVRRSATSTDLVIIICCHELLDYRFVGVSANAKIETIYVNIRKRDYLTSVLKSTLACL